MPQGLGRSITPQRQRHHEANCRNMLELIMFLRLYDAAEGAERHPVLASTPCCGGVCGEGQLG